MKKIVIFGWVLSILVAVGTWFYITKVPYLVDGTGKYLVLIDHEVNLSSYLLLSAIFIALIYTITILLKLLKESIIENRHIAYFLRTLPIFPIFGGITWMVLDLFLSGDSSDSFSRGIDFVNANVGYYTSTIEFQEMVSIGAGLTYGIGYYLTIVIFLMLLIHQILFYIKFEKLFNIEITV